MATRKISLWHVLAIGLVAAALTAAGCKATPPDEGGKARPEPTGPHASLLKLFPADKDISDCKPAGDVQVFGPAANPAETVEALEKDLGPDTAIYRAYDYVKSGTRRYTRGTAGDTVTLRIFEMKTPAEAFGIFSVRTLWPGEQQFPEVGHALASRMGKNALGFVRGTYFVLAEYSGTNSATSTLIEFARWVAGQISADGHLPAILERFPTGSVEGQRYFLHTFETLTTLPFVPQGDVETVKRMLSLSPETDVAIVGYPTATPGVLNYLFVVHYPTDGDAQSAYEAYSKFLEKQNATVAPPVRAYMAGTFNAEENSVEGYDQLANLLKGLSGS